MILQAICLASRLTASEFSDVKIRSEVNHANHAAVIHENWIIFVALFHADTSRDHRDLPKAPAHISHERFPTAAHHHSNGKSPLN